MRLSPETSGSAARARNGLNRLVMVMILSFGMTGCAAFTINTMRNQQLEPNVRPQKTPASETVTVDDLSDGIFIGIALSGGGSRAANFSAAVLLDLERIGILNKATAISSVSGSSLPAAYYGLYGVKKDAGRWNPDEVRKQMRKNFEARWIGRWFLPQNVALYWFTNFNRSDIMKEVLDSNLLHGKTFGDMGGGRPRILINATALSAGDRFVFSEERFKALHSRIDTFPVANAVMASSAFPGAFHDMTLKNYSISSGENYEHVLDGGPSDNLGTTTLLNMVKQLYSGEDKPKGCFLFVVDAYPYSQNPAHIHEADTRRFLDFIFDTNVAASSDALLMARRIDLMADLTVDVRTINVEPFQLNIGDDKIWPDPYDDLRVECAVWHLSLQRLLSPDFAGKAVKGDDYLQKDVREVAEVVNAIPTRYQLTGKDPHSGKTLNSETLQDYLFKAADYLIYLDNDKDGNVILKQVCDWFAGKGVRDLRCDR